MIAKGVASGIAIMKLAVALILTNGMLVRLRVKSHRTKKPYKNTQNGLAIIIINL